MYEQPRYNPVTILWARSQTSPPPATSLPSKTPSRPILAHLKTIWGLLGAYVNPSWIHLGPFWAQLGPIVAHLGPIWVLSWPSWGHLGSILAQLGANNPTRNRWNPTPRASFSTPRASFSTPRRSKVAAPPRILQVRRGQISLSFI